MIQDTPAEKSERRMKLDLQIGNVLGMIYRRGNVLFSPDGELLFSPVGHRVLCFDLKSRKSRVFSWETFKPISAIGVSASSHLLVAADEEGRAVLCDYIRGSVISRINFKSPVSFVSFSPDGSRVAIISDRRVSIWQVSRNEFMPFSLLLSLAPHRDDINYAEWSQDGRFLLTCSNDMTAKVLDFESGEPITLSGAHKHRIVSAHFLVREDAPGLHVVTVGQDGAAFIWDSLSTSVKSPKSKRCFHITLQKDVDGESAAAGEEYRPWISCTAWNATANLLVVGFLNGNFGIYRMDLDESHQLHSLTLSGRTVNTVALSPNGELVAFGSEDAGMLAIWDWHSESYVLKQLQQKDAVQCIAFAPFASQTLASGDKEGRVRLWNSNSGLALHAFGDKHEQQVVAMQFSSRASRVLITAGLEGKVHAYDTIRLKCFRKIDTECTLAPVLAVDPAGEVIVVADSESWDLLVIDLQMSKIIDRLTGHSGPISGLGFDPTGQRLWSSSWDKTVRVWHLFSSSGRVRVWSHQTEVVSACIRPDGRELAAATLDGRISIWSMVDEDEADPTGGTLLRTMEAKSDLSSRIRKGSSLMGAEGIIRHVEYSLDGFSLFAVGDFGFVAVFDAESKILLRKLPLSSVRTDKEEDLSKVLVARKAVLARISCNGSQLAVLSDSGILVFEPRSSDLKFDPVDLEPDVTPDAVLRLAQEGSFGRALALSFRLNMHPLCMHVWNSIPLELIGSIVAQSTPRVYERLLQLMAKQSHSFERLEAILRWTKAILQTHGLKLKETPNTETLAAVKVLGKVLGDYFKELRNAALPVIKIAS